MANELVDVLKEIVSGSTKQDEALLKLCQAMIERITAIEKRETMFHEAMQVHMDILKVHTDTNQKIREVMKALVARIEECEEHNESLLNSVLIMKELIGKLMFDGEEPVH